MASPYLIWGLPVYGLFFAWLIKKVPSHINAGVPYIYKELENEKALVSPWMAPFIFINALLTHFFGGSAGREGVGVIMGASFAHLLPKINRHYLIYGGIAAGFSSIFGTPLAAIVFAFELYAFKDVKNKSLVFCTILSALFALMVSHLLKAPHQEFVVSFTWDKELLMYILGTGLLSGVAGHFFYWGLKFYTQGISQVFQRIELRFFIGSLFICFLIFFSDGLPYSGISSELLARSFLEPLQLYDFIMKLILTIMTLSLGFKGGEVTPLFVMGASLSNSILSGLGLSNLALSSALGMVSLFGAVSATPVASAIMGGELFGWQTGILCFFSCQLARLIMGKYSVYKH